MTINNLFFVIGIMIMLLGISSCCRTNTNIDITSRNYPIDIVFSNNIVELEKLKVVESDIAEALDVINYYEKVRQGYSRIYLSDNDWSVLLTSVPSYDKTKPFQYAKYVEDREKLRSELMQRVIMLKKQIEYIRCCMTSADGYIFEKMREKDSSTNAPSTPKQ